MLRFYLVLCVLGFVLPYAALITWFLEQETLSVALVWNQIVENRLSLMAWLDFVVTAVVVAAFIRSEGRRSSMANLLPPLIGTYLVGPSFGLPLFLLLRERSLNSDKASS